MRIGVVSDTHRNKDLLDSVADWLISHQRIVTLYHLGDDYEDVADLKDRGIDIIQVPGIYHSAYRDGTMPAKHCEDVLGLRILLVHSLEKDVTRDDRAVSDIILFGHTHKHEIYIKDGLLFMNPGHLKAEIDKHAPASFGMLDIQEHTVSAKIFSMEFKSIEEIDLVRSESGLYRT